MVDNLHIIKRVEEREEWKKEKRAGPGSRNAHNVHHGLQYPDLIVNVSHSIYKQWSNLFLMRNTLQM